MNTLDVQYPQILDECISQLQAGTMSYEACLAKYPIYADQLQHDLTIVQLTQEIAIPQLSPKSVDALEAKLLKQFKQTASQSKRPTASRPQAPRIQAMPSPYLRWVAGFIIAIMLLMGAGGGTVYASSSSLPGETLYGVKLAWEQLIVLVSVFLNNQDEVWLQLTQTRANEVLALYADGRLTDEVLDSFYDTAETAMLTATDDTEQAYIDLVDSLRPTFSSAVLISTSETRRFRILRILSPEMDANGQLILPDGEEILPQSTDEPTATVTLSPTASPTLTETATQTQTPTVTYTPSLTLEPTQTRTSTPTRTPTLVPSATLTLTLTPQPTATWTPLGIQPRGEEPTSTGNTGQQITNDVKPTKPFFTGESEFFVRETERSVELTQTAIAMTPTPSS